MIFGCIVEPKLTDAGEFPAGLELRSISVCVHFRAIRAIYPKQYMSQDFEGLMRGFMWAQKQEAVSHISHCLTATSQMA